MSYLKKTLHYRHAALGLEWVALKKLPIVVLGGTLIPVSVSVLSRLLPAEGTAAEIAKHITSVDILAVSLVLTVWMSALTVAIGCIMVLLIKGPASSAGAYYLPDVEQPIR